ncbi:MAG TPA: DUF819 family protein [Acidobacteriota bacterium]|nr:DUF819 family protein [Acidobacteriota bacterium]
MESLISPNDTWLLWAIMLITVGVSIYSEQTYKWASKITGPVLALVVAVVLSNLKVMPIQSPSYDVVWTYVVPLCIPLLLFRANIFKIVKTTGSMFGAFHVSALGTLIGAVVAAFTFQTVVPHIAKLSGIMTASYIGGGVNFFAVQATFKAPEELTNALLVSDNVIMTIMFLVLISLTGFKFFRKHYPMPHQLEVENSDSKDDMQAANFWKRKEISLLDIAKALGVAIFIAALSAKLSELIRLAPLPGVALDILSNQFLLITTISVAVATVFHKQLENIAGSDELGTYLIYIFFFTIGLPADIWLIIQRAPVLFLYCIVIAGINFLVTFGLGKLFKMKLEDLALSVSANLGGPMNAAAMAIAKGWKALVLPALLVGIWGYVIGTYLGIIVGNILLAVM